MNEKVNLEKNHLLFFFFQNLSTHPMKNKKVRANIISLLLLMFTSRDTDSLLHTRLMHTRFLGCHNDGEKAQITTTKEFVKK